MNPHLNYGQSIPGRTEGRFIGIIDGRSFAVLVDAIALLETSGALTRKKKQDSETGLKNISPGLPQVSLAKRKTITGTTIRWRMMCRPAALHIFWEKTIM
jgi:hypothetical protein